MAHNQPAFLSPPPGNQTPLYGTRIPSPNPYKPAGFTGDGMNSYGSRNASSYSTQETFATRSQSSTRQRASDAQESTTSSTRSFAEFDKFTRTITLSDCALNLSDSFLEASWIGLDGKDASGTLDLDEWIGVESGTLRWNRKGFSRSSSNISLTGTTISASCRFVDTTGTERTQSSTIDLLGCISITRGNLVPTPSSPDDLSSFMSQANWMNLLVVSEPDIDVLLGSPEFKNAIIGVAENAISRAMEQTQLMMQEFLNYVAETVEKNARQSIEQQLEWIIRSGQLTRAASVASPLSISGHRDWMERAGGGGSVFPPVSSRPTTPSPLRSMGSGRGPLNFSR